MNSTKLSWTIDTKDSLKIIQPYCTVFIKFIVYASTVFSLLSNNLIAFSLSSKNLIAASQQFYLKLGQLGLPSKSEHYTRIGSIERNNSESYYKKVSEQLQ